MNIIVKDIPVGKYCRECRFLTLLDTTTYKGTVIGVCDLSRVELNFEEASSRFKKGTYCVEGRNHYTAVRDSNNIKGSKSSFKRFR